MSYIVYFQKVQKLKAGGFGVDNWCFCRDCYYCPFAKYKCTRFYGLDYNLIRIEVDAAGLADLQSRQNVQIKKIITKGV